MNYKFLFFGIFFLSCSCFSQKRQEHLIEAGGITGINITSDEISRVEIRTYTENNIRISSGIEGETFESMLVNTEVVDSILNINSNRTPYYEEIDDKLAAHKVISVVLKLTIPEDLELWVDSAIATVNLAGTYKYINLNLGQGDCLLKPFYGNGIVNTRSGRITVDTHESEIKADSRHGKVSVENSEYSTYALTLKSLTGAIIVKQSE